MHFYSVLLILNFKFFTLFIKYFNFHFKIRKLMEETQPYKKKTYFINNINSYLGYFLVNQLRNDHEVAENPNEFIGNCKSKTHLF